jgi:4-hydroxy-tetrahydrodipicolinate synthase
MLFTGVMTAIVTPFKDGMFDEKAFRDLIDWQIKSGVDVLVPCATTGEGSTLTLQEHDRILRVAVEQASGRVPIVAGCGSNSTVTAIKLARQAKAAGADGQLQVTPYYNKPTQEGLYQHFKAIAAVVDLPMVLYNVPGRTAVNMLPETVLRLTEIETIVGLKEASGNMDQIKKIISEVPGSFGVYSGDDALNFEIYTAGGRGCVSVTSNVVPSLVCGVWDQFAAGHAESARKKHEDLALLNRAMFIETNPIPAKTALALMGKITEEFRLPMTPMSEGRKEELRGILVQYKLLP